MIMLRSIVAVMVCSFNSVHPLTYIFSHGLGSSSARALHYTKSSLGDIHFSGGWRCLEADRDFSSSISMNILNLPLITVQYPHDRAIPFENGVIKKRDIKRDQVGLAQYAEINALRKAIQMANDEVILYGHSMGASTILTYLATYGCSGIKALILEAPFDCVESVIDYKCGIFSWTGVGTLACKIAFPNYNPYGITPISSIRQRRSVKHWCPIMFIHSYKDELVPYACSERLYDALKAAGHEHLYMVTLHKSGHNYLNSDDMAYCETAIHAFYKYYGLPYDVTLAEAGNSMFPGGREYYDKYRYRGLPGSVKMDLLKDFSEAELNDPACRDEIFEKLRVFNQPWSSIKTGLPHFGFFGTSK